MYDVIKHKFGALQAKDTINAHTGERSWQDGAVPAQRCLAGAFIGAIDRTRPPPVALQEHTLAIKRRLHEHVREIYIYTHIYSIHWTATTRSACSSLQLVCAAPTQASPPTPH